MRASRALLLTAFILALPSPPRTGAQQWTRLDLSASPTPAPRRNATMVFDAPGRRLVVFGGHTAAGDAGDVWAFSVDSFAWAELTPGSGTGPAPRFGHASIFDPAARRMIVWSGQGSQFYDDAWAFDLATETWTGLSPTGTVPTQRYGSAAVHDSRQRRMVIFAGFTASGRFGDTRALDLSTPAWSDLTPSVPGPIERCLHTAAFDSSNNVMYVYGGQNDGPLDDLWAFDFDLGSWSDLTVADRPDGRILPTAVFLGGEVIVFGGSTQEGRVDETWAYRPGDSLWTLIAPSGPVPPARDGHAACADPADGAMYVFGGTGDSLLADVWRFTGAVTSVIPDAGRPATFPLFEAYPNPFNPTTTFSFVLPEAGSVRVDVTDLRGSGAAVVFEGERPAGPSTVHFDATGFPSGVYFARLTGPGVSLVRKILLLR